MPAAPGAGVTDVHADGKFYFFKSLYRSSNYDKAKVKRIRILSLFFFNFYFLMFTLLG